MTIHDPAAPKAPERSLAGATTMPPTSGPVVAIPALAPDSALPHLVGRLQEQGVEVIVVDDGSGPAYDVVFDRCAVQGAILVRERVNHGKGDALRRAFAVAQELFPGAGVVTADADGQHTVADILAIRERLATQPARGPERPIVLGVRTQERTDVPLRSRFGNWVSAGLFRLAAGTAVADTQTGLRGIPAEHLDWAGRLHGDRYEYETSMLLRAAREGKGIDQIPIRTVYLEDNASSHFRPLRDSLRVMGPMLGFAASGLATFGLDTGLFLGFMALGGAMWPSLIAGRIISGGVNFTLNRRLVFRAHRDADGEPRRVLPDLLGYAAVAVVIALGGGLIIDGLMAAGIGALPAKIAADLSMFLVSFALQRLVLFGRRALAGSSSRVAAD